MTAADPRFGPIFAGSLLIHAAFLAIALLLPGGGGPSEIIPAYTVKIVEAPTVPEARALDLSPAMRQAMNLEAPSLATNAPPLPTAPAPDVTGLDAPRLPSALTPLPPAPGAPRTNAPPADPVPGKPLPAPPVLPQAPAARPSRSTPSSPRAASSLPAPPGVPAAPALPEGPSLEERLRAKVQNLNLQVESAETPAATQQPSAERDRSIISLRLFQNTVRERVKKNYTFPGSFPEDLRARVRVIIERSGKLRSAEITESSGNGRFDNLVCLAAIRNAKYPPLPEGIEGDTHTLFLTCSP